LVKLARAIDWGFLEQRFGAVYEPARLMAGLAIPKRPGRRAPCAGAVSSISVLVFCRPYSLTGRVGVSMGYGSVTHLIDGEEEQVSTSSGPGAPTPQDRPHRRQGGENAGRVHAGRRLPVVLGFGKIPQRRIGQRAGLSPLRQAMLPKVAIGSCADFGITASQIRRWPML